VVRKDIVHQHAILGKIVNIGKMIWVPKGSLIKTKIQGPKKIWVPKSKI